MMQPVARKTKVIWSIDGGQLSEDFASSLMDKKIDALRIVFKKQNQDQVLNFLDLLNEKRDISLPHIPIMVDLARQSRAALVGIEEPIDVEFSKEIRFVKADDGAKSDGIAVKCENLEEVFQKDAVFYIGYGNVVLKTKEVTSKYVVGVVEKGGIIYPESDLHAPQSRKSSLLGDYSTEMIDSLVQRRVDYLVLPGITESHAISEFRAKLVEAGIRMPWILLRVDSKNMYNLAKDVIEEVDGLFISRREIALTADGAMVPMITKELIALCNNKAKLVVTASEMLASMRFNATPTRAEVSDVANAVIDGADAVVLSEDISEGRFGYRSYTLAERIISEVEQSHQADVNWIKREPEIRDELDAVSLQAYKTAHRVKAKAIVCITEGGNTALRLSSFRPPIPIIAVTFSDDVSRKLCLVRGVDGVVLDIDPNLDEVLPTVNDLLKQESWLEVGDKIVFVTVTISPLGREASNLFTVQTID